MPVLDATGNPFPGQEHTLTEENALKTFQQLGGHFGSIVNTRMNVMRTPEYRIAREFTDGLAASHQPFIMLPATETRGGTNIMVWVIIHPSHTIELVHAIVDRLKELHGTQETEDGDEGPEGTDDPGAGAGGDVVGADRVADAGAAAAE